MQSSLSRRRNWFRCLCWLVLLGAALAVGNAGRASRSAMSQAGTWATQTSGTTKDLLSVHFVNDCDGWAAGRISGLRHTTNCGVTWQTAEFPCLGPEYHSVRFLDQNTGWIGGTDLAARTTNGGGNWTCLPLSTAFVDRNSLFPISVNVAWAVGRETSGPRNFFRYNFSGTPTEEIFGVASSTEFFDIYCPDTDTCWAVGGAGKIVRITNASGTPPTFTQQTSPTTQQLNDVQMLDLNTGWAVGNNGVILTTSNGGTNWTAQTSGTTTALKGVHFKNANEGWAVGIGGLILTTSNGGTNWAPETSGTTNDLENVFFTSNAGYAVGLTGKILKRSSGACTVSATPPSFTFSGAGGSNSVTITAPVGCGWSVTDDATWLTFSSATNGGGNGTVNFNIATNTGAARSATITITGEANTVTVSVNQDFDCNLNLATSPVSRTQPAAGGTGTVNVTGLAQCNWTATPSAPWIQITAGGSGAGNGTVSYSVDANLGPQRSGTITIGPRLFTIYQVGSCNGPWCWQASGTSNFLNEVHFINDNEGWAAGLNATLRHTTDGGATWTGPPSTPGILSSDGFNSVRFLDQNIGWAGGISAVSRTGNGGASWATGLLSTNVFRHSYFPTSSTVAWAAGSNTSNCRYFFRYTYNGPSFTEQSWSVCPGPTLLGIYCVDADNCWAVGTAGTIVRITSASAATPSFSSQTSGVAVTLYGLQMLDLNTGWAVGLGGTMLKTTNGGANWTPQTSGVTTRLNTVHFLNANEGWVVGTGGVILRTTNGGASWSPESSGVFTELAGVFFPSANAGFAVGESGVILKRRICPAITLTPAAGALPAGTQATAYNQDFTASGGTPSYTFSVSTGSMPPGLSLSTGGALTGTPTTPGNYSFTLNAADTTGCAGTAAYSLTINCPAITLSPATLPNGTANTAYSQTLTPDGGTTPYTCSLSAGALPAGISLSNCQLSGTPTAAGASNFTISVADANNCPGSQPYALTIQPANTAPGIGAVAVTRLQGSPASNATIANVSDNEQAASTLSVMVNGGASATVNSVTVSGLSVSAAGVVTADVAASCAATNASFTLRVTDSGGLFAEAMLTVTVTPNPPPIITTHPAAQTVCELAAATFSVTVSGTGPFTYQWRKNSVNISGATNSSFNIAAAAAGDAGSYDVVVTGACGSATSNAAALTVNTAPSVITQHLDQIVNPGNNATFTAAANASPAPSVQWQVSTDGGANFSNIIGATSPTLTLSNVTLGQNNNRYRAVFTNPCNTATTISAMLTVSPLAINNVIPPAGRVSGGQQIKLVGSFVNLLTVMVGGVSANWSYSNGTNEVTVTTPAHSVGAVDIVLTPTSGSPYTKTNAFAYLPTVFTDDVLVAGVTTPKAQHIIELRNAVDSLRLVAGLGLAPWTDATLSPSSTVIKTVHITELRTNLEQAAMLLGYGAGSYTDPALASGLVIKRVHIEELRQRIRTIAG